MTDQIIKEHNFIRITWFEYDISVLDFNRVCVFWRIITKHFFLTCDNALHILKHN